MPRKRDTQRKLRFQAPLHRRQDMVSAHVSPELRKEVKKRSMRVKTGYVVRVMRGSFKGKEGKVIGVSLKDLKIAVEGVVRKRADGKEVPVPLDPSNVMIISLKGE